MPPASRPSNLNGVSMDDVLQALHRAGGGPQYASELDLKGTVQAISGALRHAKDRGLVQANYGLGRGGLWSLTVRGRMRVNEIEMSK